MQPGEHLRRGWCLGWDGAEPAGVFPAAVGGEPDGADGAAGGDRGCGGVSGERAGVVRERGEFRRRWRFGERGAVVNRGPMWIFGRRVVWKLRRAFPRLSVRLAVVPRSGQSARKCRRAHCGSLLPAGDRYVGRRIRAFIACRHGRESKMKCTGNATAPIKRSGGR